MQQILSFKNELTGVEIRLTDVEHSLVVRRHWINERNGNPCFQTIGGFFKKAVSRAIDNPTEFAL